MSEKDGEFAIKYENIPIIDCTPKSAMENAAAAALATVLFKLTVNRLDEIVPVWFL